MESSRRYELHKLEFEKSLEQRKFEISNFWSRGWFFGALLLLMAKGYFDLKPESQEYAIYLAFLGFWTSFFQSLMNRGSKYWQERWENKTKNTESALGIDVTLTKKYEESERYYLDAGILAKNENFFASARRFSVSKLTILVWDIITISWFMLWVKSCNIHFDGIQYIRLDALVYHLILSFYIFYFFMGKSKFVKSEGETVRWSNGLFGFSGGKVYEPFMRKKTGNNPKNIREPFLSDSEKYYKDEI